VAAAVGEEAEAAVEAPQVSDPLAASQVAAATRAKEAAQQPVLELAASQVAAAILRAEAVEPAQEQERAAAVPQAQEPS
jgi:hypothetical protein